MQLAVVAGAIEGQAGVENQAALDSGRANAEVDGAAPARIWPFSVTNGDVVLTKKPSSRSAGL